MSENPASLLEIIAQASPILAELKAAKTNLESYSATARNYADLAKAEQAKITAIMAELAQFSELFVLTYLNDNPVPTPPPEVSP